jgi:hypothetical protein
MTDLEFSGLQSKARLTEWVQIAGNDGESVVSKQP